MEFDPEDPEVSFLKFFFLPDSRSENQNQERWRELSPGEQKNPQKTQNHSYA